MGSFNLSVGYKIADKYKILELLGGGYEGEVYKIVEVLSGIKCAAKIFYPNKNPKNKVARNYAKKLHALRDCDVILKYYTQDQIILNEELVTVFIYEYVEGLMLSTYLKNQPGKRLTVFKAVHLLYTILDGLELIHHHGFVHGDLHEENIIIRRIGLSYDLKLLDFYNVEGTKKDNEMQDMIDAIKIFYNALGGMSKYKKQPPQVKEICCGLKHNLIKRKFRNISSLKLHLENQEW